jgi:DNA primase
VATLGTATTAEHLQKLFQVCEQVIFCFDGDRAGKEAAWRAMNNTLPVMKAGKLARFMFLPDGEDPDSLIRARGKEGFEAEIGHAMSFSDFFFEKLTRSLNMDSHDDRYRLIEQSKEYLQHIKEPGFLRLMASRLADLAELQDIEKIDLLSQLGIDTKGALKAGAGRGFSRDKPVAAVPRQAPMPIKKAIGYLLQYPDLATRAGDPGRFLALDMDGIELFVQLLDLLQLDPQLNTARILLHWQNTPQYQYLVSLAKPPLITDREAIGNEFDATLELLMRQHQQQRFEQLQRKERKQGLESLEKREYFQLLRAMKPV